MIYKIRNTFLNVTNEIEEYEEIIAGRFSQFEIVNKTTNNCLIFNKDKVIIKINKKEIIFNNRIIKTDIYPIINNIISHIVNDERNMFIHSVVVSKEKKGLLLVGNFRQGKSTLAEEMKKYGYRINSTDQTWLTIDNNELYQTIGSRYYVKNGIVKFLEKSNSDEKVKIEKIIGLIGLCDNGYASCYEQQNLYYKIKTLAPFCNWSYSAPLFTDDQELFNTNKYVRKFLVNINETTIPLIEVRGDKNKIIQELKLK